jgi:HAD superfamily hydrolase (TIGR01662 family)
MTRMLDVDVAIPTIGRPSLTVLLDALAAQGFPGRVFVVDDRRERWTPLPIPPGGSLDVVVLRGTASGPGAARNIAWRASTATWIAFLDDDVVPGPDWSAQLLVDLTDAGGAAGSQGTVRVPLSSNRRPTDWERNVASLETAKWVTADMAYRRAALRALGGFDERFPRAYREDADLALRTLARGWRLTHGRRVVEHPVRPAPWHVSVTKQAGNADDSLMLRIHGRAWRGAAGAGVGAFARHVVTVAAGIVALATAVLGRRRAASLAAAVWLLLTGSFVRRRVAPGPRTLAECSAMVVTSVAIPPSAVWHRVRGACRARRRDRSGRPAVEAVLFDRDGTLIVDVPYNGDPDRVAPVAGAREALDRLRAAGVPIGMVSNQSGVGRGLLTEAEVDKVNARVAELLGPFDVVALCEHAPGAGCGCRKPRPGLVRAAAHELGVPPDRCALVGDIGADVGAALAANARAVLVPTSLTRADEISAAPVVAGDLETAVDLLLGVP